MFEVKIPKEIKEYKEKIVFGMTVRQLVCISLALIVSIPSYFFGRNYIPEELLGWLVIAVGMLLGGLGYYKKNGMSLERHFLIVLKFTFLYPKKRKYKGLSLSDRIIEQEYQCKLEQFHFSEKKKGYY